MTIAAPDMDLFDAKTICCGIHPISPRETLAFRPARDSDVRSTACIPPAFLDVCRGVTRWLFGILYGCPALDTRCSGSAFRSRIRHCPDKLYGISNDARRSTLGFGCIFCGGAPPRFSHCGLRSRAVPCNPCCRTGGTLEPDRPAQFSGALPRHMQLPPRLVPPFVQTAEWLGIQRSVVVGGVTQSATRQQGVPGDDAAAPPAQLDIKSLRIGARCVEHQQ